MKESKIKYFIIFILTVNSAFSQKLQFNRSKDALIHNATEIYNAANESESTFSKVVNTNALKSGINKIHFENLFRTETDNNSSGFFSDLTGNFNFGSITENYAYVSFTPKMYIQPADFISIYANHNLLKLFPITEMNKYAYSIFIQSLALAGTQKSFELLFESKSWLSDLAIFAAKNLVLNLVIKPVTKPDNRELLPWIQDESFYYSVSIRF